MGTLGHQVFALYGSRLYVQRKPIGGVVQPTIDLGVIQPANPSVEPTRVELIDSDGGVNRVVAQALTQFNEAYDIQCSNMNADNMALLFGSDPVQAYTQSATPVEDRVIYAHPGRLVRIVDEDGKGEVSLASIQSVTGPGGTPTYDEGDDWEVVSLDRGLIRMISGGAFAAAGNVEVSYTRNAITAESRLIEPQSGGIVEVFFWLYWSADGYEREMMREGEAALSVNAASISSTEFSNFTMQLRVLTDATKTTEQAGRLLTYKGDLPSVS